MVFRKPRELGRILKLALGDPETLKSSVFDEGLRKVDPFHTDLLFYPQGADLYFHTLNLPATLLALPEPPDVVFALNDLLALGVLRGLADAGLRVPEDVAVVGFDDIEQSRYAVPSLTTVAPDKEAVARSAVEHLARRLDVGDAWEPEEVTIGARLVVRESSGG